MYARSPHQTALKPSAEPASRAPYIGAMAQYPDAADGRLTGKKGCNRQQSPMADDEAGGLRTCVQQRPAIFKHRGMGTNTRPAQVNPLAGTSLCCDTPL
jgi:hypothetical protein